MRKYFTGTNELTPTEKVVQKFFYGQRRTAKETAIKLSEKLGQPKSDRTIEKHLENIRSKTGKHYRSDYSDAEIAEINSVSL